MRAVVSWNPSLITTAARGYWREHTLRSMRRCNPLKLKHSLLLLLHLLHTTLCSASVTAINTTGTVNTASTARATAIVTLLVAPPQVAAVEDAPQRCGLIVFIRVARVAERPPPQRHRVLQRQEQVERCNEPCLITRQGCPDPALRRAIRLKPRQRFGEKEKKDSELQLVTVVPLFIRARFVERYLSGIPTVQ